jgi:hypothetical protein
VNEAVDKMIALMEQSVKQSDPGNQTNLWDWYAGHALCGVMSASPHLGADRIGYLVAEAVNAVMARRPKT